MSYLLKILLRAFSVSFKEISSEYRFNGKIKNIRIKNKIILK
jgi:hypothetical protein